MILQGVCNSYKLELFLAQHQPLDQYRIALYTSEAKLSKATRIYMTDGEVPSSGAYEAGGKTLEGFRAGLDGDTAFVTFDTPVWDVATITARGALVYNATKDNRAVAVLDFGQDISSTNGSFTANMPVASAGTALIRIT